MVLEKGREEEEEGKQDACANDGDNNEDRNVDNAEEEGAEDDGKGTALGQFAWGREDPTTAAA